MVDWEGLKSDIETYFTIGKASAALGQLGQSLAEQRRQQIASRNAVVTVVNNNVPNGTLGCGEWLVIVQTAPNVTLDIGAKLVKSEQHEKDQRVIAAAEKMRDDALYLANAANAAWRLLSGKAGAICDVGNLDAAISKASVAIAGYDGVTK